MTFSLSRRVAGVVRSLPSAGRLVVNKSMALRHLRNRWRYPGLDCDPAVSFTGDGSLSYAAGASLSAGCNVVVARGTRLALGRGCFIGRHVELGPDTSISIGDHTSIQDRCVILGNVSIGRYCVFSYDIYISSGNHVFDRRPAALIKDQDREFGAEAGPDMKPVIIDDDVWLGVHVVVMPGVTIGRGSVVGANSVVTRSLPPYSVAAGAPARVIRKRLEFTPPQAIDWQQEEHIPYFYRGFETSAQERLNGAATGGHVAPRDFAVALKRGPDRKIHVRARGDGGREAVVTCGTRSYTLEPNFAVYEFDDSHQECIPSTLAVFGVSGGPVVISSAWTT